MSDDQLRSLRDIMQFDIGNRGLAKDPQSNLFNAFPDDFADACRSIAGHANPRVGIVTGFMIPSVDPPMGETDGPLGAIFLARAFTKLGIGVVLISDHSAFDALRSAVSILPELGPIPVLWLPNGEVDQDAESYQKTVFDELEPVTHMIALERVGVNHDAKSIALQCDGDSWEVPEFTAIVPVQMQRRYYTMRGRDITELTRPADLLFDRSSPFVTIGIGDGGNEIGMGNIAWHTIGRNIPNGELIACSVSTDFLLVAGISNWGAYALAAGVMLLRGQVDLELFDLRRERELLENMVAFGPLVDGVTGQRTASVDGIAFDEYASVLQQIGDVVASKP